MKQDSKIYVAGHRGLVGGAIIRKLKAAGYTNLITKTHGELDLTHQDAVNSFFMAEKPEYVFLAAAKVGGIGANSHYPADFIYENSMISFNVIHASYQYNVRKLMNLGSSCIYPKMAPQPLKEEYLLSGYLEPTNDAYAIAKISAIKLCTAYNKQYGTNFLSAMPTNLYGPGDNYDLNNSHVFPALIRKFHEAKISVTDKVILWGDGSPYREFMYSDDLANAVVYLMEHCNAEDLRNDAGDFINIGTGKDMPIKELAELICGIVYKDAPGRICEIEWDASKPNGTPKKLLDISRLNMLGFKSGTSLEEGIRKAYNDFVSKVTSLATDGSVE
ncbi:MAG: GDP-L-fucose synthase [Spirochaetaceae bacterium]|jgi:GDP-L-fucose synthase|nr:GDP-L-fucose synthase [Spirochaetaceae bacterium]